MATAGDYTAKLKYKCLAADNWSLYPATSNVNMACKELADVGGLSFCDTNATMSDEVDHIDLSGQFIFNQPPQTAAAPTDADDLVNKAYADNNSTWSTYPATQDVDMSCNSVVNVGTITMCDTTTLGTRVSDPTVFDISANDTLVVQSVGPGATASMTLNGTTDTVTFSTPPLVSITNVNTASQLVPRAYLDNLINMALPAIAGYLPGTCYNAHKNMTRGSNLAIGLPVTDISLGVISFMYPLIDTTVSRVVFYSGSAVTPPATFGLSLVEYPAGNLSSTVAGTCIATTGNIGSGGFNLVSNLINRRFAIQLRNSGGTPASFTLRAGRRYGITLASNTAYQVVGFIFSTSNLQFSTGVYTTTPPDVGYRNEVMSAAVYGYTGWITGATPIPPVGANVTIINQAANPGVPQVGVEP